MIAWFAWGLTKLAMVKRDTCSVEQWSSSGRALVSSPGPAVAEPSMSSHLARRAQRETAGVVRRWPADNMDMYIGAFSSLLSRSPPPIAPSTTHNASQHFPPGCFPGIASGCSPDPASACFPGSVSGCSSGPVSASSSSYVPGCSRDGHRPQGPQDPQKFEGLLRMGSPGRVELRKGSPQSPRDALQMPRVRARSLVTALWVPIGPRLDTLVC